jgi:hypothetical protein
MSGTSAVSICSNALLLLGDRPIDSFDVDNDRTRLVINLYSSMRDAMLRGHPWNCATKRVILSPRTQAPAFGWGYQFNLPDDWLRTMSVGEDDDPDDYVIEGRMILMNSNVCKLRYIFRNDVESSWDALLINCMTKAMVASLSYAVTKSTTKQASDEEIVNRILKQARAVDGQENPPETLGDFPLLANRMR